MSLSWYVEHNGKTVGPATFSQLKRLARSGKINRQTRVRRGDNGDWVRAGKVQGFFAASDFTSPKEELARTQPPPTDPTRAQPPTFSPSGTASANAVAATVFIVIPLIIIMQAGLIVFVTDVKHDIENLPPPRGNNNLRGVTEAFKIIPALILSLVLVCLNTPLTLYLWVLCCRYLEVSNLKRHWLALTLCVVGFLLGLVQFLIVVTIVF